MKSIWIPGQVSIALFRQWAALDVMSEFSKRSSKSDKFMNAIVKQICDALSVQLRSIKQHVITTVGDCCVPNPHPESVKFHWTDVPLLPNRLSSDAWKKYGKRWNGKPRNIDGAEKRINKNKKITKGIVIEQFQVLRDAIAHTQQIIVACKPWNLKQALFRIIKFAEASILLHGRDAPWSLSGILQTHQQTYQENTRLRHRQFCTFFIQVSQELTKEYCKVRKDTPDLDANPYNIRIWSHIRHQFSYSPLSRRATPLKSMRAPPCGSLASSKRCIKLRHSMRISAWSRRYRKMSPDREMDRCGTTLNWLALISNLT